MNNLLISCEDKNVSDFNIKNMKHDLSKDEQAKIISTRIRVARNLDGFPLGAGLTKTERLDVMEKVKAACHTFPGMI